RRAFDPSDLRIAIQDSTGQPGAAEAIADKLKQAGYRDVYIADAWVEPLSETRIVAQQGDDEGAKAIHQSLGFGEVRVESTGNLRSDITIKIGKDWLQKKNLSN
ncbi:LytR C-terminal domain-containing protein, partial [Planktothrix sp. FACHB-1355]